MKKIILLLLSLSLVSWFFDKNDDEKKNFIIKKYFQNDNTFIIICKGWPKEELTGKARIESAKEAALINAQFTARDLFNKPVDVVKNGKIKKYDVYDDYVAVHYVIKYRGLRRLLKK